MGFESIRLSWGLYYLKNVLVTGRKGFELRSNTRGDEIRIKQQDYDCDIGLFNSVF